MRGVSEEYPSVICSSTSRHETKHRNKTRVPRYIKHTSNVARTKRTQLFPLTKVDSRCCSRLPRSPISWKNKTKTQELTAQRHRLRRRIRWYNCNPLQCRCR